MYSRRSPRAAVLRPFVDSIELVRQTPLRDHEFLVPTADVAMIFTLAEDGSRSSTPSSGGLRAPRSSDRRAPRRWCPQQAQRGMLAVNFRPGGALPFLREPLSEAADSFVPLARHWGTRSATLRERLLACPDDADRIDLVERALVEAMTDAAVDGAIRAAVTALERGDRVTDVVENFGTTSKPFIRRFTQAVGVTPKRYARVRRIQRVLRCLPVGGEIDWASVAVEHGFYDQSHLVHDFTEITGGSPSGHRSPSTGEVNHLAF